MRRNRAGQMGIGGKIVQRGGDLGGPAKAMPHHAIRPIGVCCACAHHAADFFGYGARTRDIGAGAVQMVKRRRVNPQMRKRRRKPAFVGGIIGGHQHIGFQQILHMGKGIGRRQTRLYPGAVMAHLTLGVDGPAGSGQPRLTRRRAPCIRVIG